MDDPFLPWWLVLLLGMWAVALTVWCYPRVNREIRLWAGLATLFYCLLIFLALGGGGGSGGERSISVSDLLLCVLMAISITASIWIISRFPVQSRQIAYVILTGANTLVCFYWRQFEVALGLLVIMALHLRPLIQVVLQQKIRPSRKLFVELARFEEVDEAPESRGEFLLFGVLTGVAALLLLGTVSYAVRTETARAISSPRHSVLPSAELLTQVFAQRSNTQQEFALGELILGARSDILVLLTVIVFLSLAMTMSAQSETRGGSFCSSAGDPAGGAIGEAHDS